jgi:hypothetical protein
MRLWSFPNTELLKQRSQIMVATSVLELGKSKKEREGERKASRGANGSREMQTRFQPTTCLSYTLMDEAAHMHPSKTSFMIGAYSPT